MRQRISRGQRRPHDLVRKRTEKLMRIRKRSGFGLNEVIGIAAGIIIAALVIIPGLRTFAEGVITDLGTWWTSMTATLFATT